MATVPGGGEVLKKGAEEGKCAKNYESKQPAAATSVFRGALLSLVLVMRLP